MRSVRLLWGSWNISLYGNVFVFVLYVHCYLFIFLFCFTSLLSAEYFRRERIFKGLLSSVSLLWVWRPLIVYGCVIVIRWVSLGVFFFPNSFIGPLFFDGSKTGKGGYMLPVCEVSICLLWGLLVCFFVFCIVYVISARFLS